MEDKFKALPTSTVFENLIQVFDVCLWPIDKNCDNELLAVISNHYKQRLTQNSYNILQVPTEWDRLKSYSLKVTNKHELSWSLEGEYRMLNEECF